MEELLKSYSAGMLFLRNNQRGVSDDALSLVFDHANFQHLQKYGREILDNPFHPTQTSNLRVLYTHGAEIVDFGDEDFLDYLSRSDKDCLMESLMHFTLNIWTSD